MRETMEKIERLTMAGFLIDTVVMALIVTLSKGAREQLGGLIIVWFILFGISAIARIFAEVKDV